MGEYTNVICPHKKLIKFGHTKVIILCERGTMFGYNDLVVDSRNLVWMKGPENLVSMDITHCLQQPAQLQTDGTVKSGGGYGLRRR